MGEGSRPVYRVITGIYPPYVMYNDTAGAFFGYCIDLLNDIASFAGFDYVIKFLNYRDPITGQWNIIDELTRNATDIAVGPIWITSYLSKVVDFTIPYGSSGFSIMMLREKRQAPYLRFLTILELEVWIGLAFAFLLTIFLLYILERYSPFSYRNNREKYRDEPDDRFCSLKECFWFAFTSITPQGGGDIPKNLSGKMVAATWWLFGFVIVAAYTANLAAYETLDRLERNVESLEDLRRQFQIQYSVVANSTAYEYFSRMRTIEEKFYLIWRNMTLDESVPESNRSGYVVWDYPLENKYMTMYYAMEGYGFFRSVEEAVKFVQKVNRAQEFAFIGEAITIKYLILTDCNFKQVGKQFGKKPFAFALRKDSMLKERIDDAITHLAVRGRLNVLAKKWWEENPLRMNCPAEKYLNMGFDLDNLAVVFLLILLGILLAILILCLEFCWYRYRVQRTVVNVQPFAGTRFTSPRTEGDE